jgi:hypothetical protein
MALDRGRSLVFFDGSLASFPLQGWKPLMRQADIRITMNIVGDAASEDMREAHGKIVQLALPTSVNGTNGT